MNLKLFLVLMTVVAVISDSMLHPLYPQYFSEVFGVTNSHHVGFYIAACSLTVMLSFPFWACLAKKIDVLRLLILTQLATGTLSIACCRLTNLYYDAMLGLGSRILQRDFWGPRRIYNLTASYLF